MSDALRTDDYVKASYTYADYLEWEGPERYELLSGEAYMMASPTVAHQRISKKLLVQFDNWLEGKPSEIFSAPLDVRPFPKKNKSDSTIVQPDLLVVCDDNKLSKGSVDGAPDLVIEIISPSNTHSKLFLKFQYYLKAGVREYWVVDPESKSIQVHVYDNGRYISTFYNKDANIPVAILPGLKITLKDLWAKAKV